MVMTADEKRDRRKAKHEIQHIARKMVINGAGLHLTSGQIDSYAKVIANRTIKRYQEGK